MEKGMENFFLPEDQKKEGRVQVGFGCFAEGKGMEFLNKVWSPLKKDKMIYTQMKKLWYFNFVYQR